MTEISTTDVVVIGCGIAGLSAAVSALQAGAQVVILERAPKEERGGNTRWTESLLRMKSETEVSDDFEAHFMANAGHHLDPSLVRETARDYLCYDVKCPTPTSGLAGQVVSDQFGEHVVTTRTSSTLCVPAISGPVPRPTAAPRQTSCRRCG